jgi:hypothetical protein
VFVTPEERKLEVIFVSSDRTAQEMASYFTESHGNWLSLDYSARDVKDLLSQCGNPQSSPATSRACPSTVYTRRGTALTHIYMA